MTLMVTLEIAKLGNTCDPAYAEMEKYFAEKNITAISVEEMIAHWKSLKRRDWALWLYRNKGVFEQLTAQAIPQEELDKYTADYQYLESEVVVGYRIGPVIYGTLQEAEAARAIKLEELKVQIEPQVVCNLEVLDEHGNATWSVIDLDDVVIPDNASIKVFNPVTGQYTTCTTQAEALSYRDKFILQVSDCVDGSAKIYEVKKHPDFPDEEAITV
jgi:hypothetical protein